MSKFHCMCGHVSSDVAFPTYHEGHIISDRELDERMDYKNGSIVWNNAWTRNLIECKECGRLWIERYADNPDHTRPRARPAYVSFLPETERLLIWEDGSSFGLDGPRHVGSEKKQGEES